MSDATPLSPWVDLASGADVDQALGELSTFGSRARGRITGSSGLSPWGAGAWPVAANELPVDWRRGAGGQTPHSGSPAGIVVHYTAAATLAGTVEWFCRLPLGAEASAHFVIGRAPEPWMPDLAADLPWVRQLPVPVVACRSLAQPAYHATWANGLTIGIELVNLGCGVPQPRSAPGTVLEGSGAQQSTRAAWGRSWQTYPQPQVETLAVLLRVLTRYFQLPQWSIVGHEHVQGTVTPGGRGEDKRDPGPMLPWQIVRPVVFADPFDGSVSLDVKTMLVQLGYSVSGGGLRPSVAMFQRMMGLTVDGVAGPKTTAALMSRCADRGIGRTGL